MCQWPLLHLPVATEDIESGWPEWLRARGLTGGQGRAGAMGAPLQGAEHSSC